MEALQLDTARTGAGASGGSGTSPKMFSVTTNAAKPEGI